MAIGEENKGGGYVDGCLVIFAIVDVVILLLLKKNIKINIRHTYIRISFVCTLTLMGPIVEVYYIQD